MGVGVGTAMRAAIPSAMPCGSRGRKASKDSASDAKSAKSDSEAPWPDPFQATTATGSGRPRRGGDARDASGAGAGWSHGLANGFLGS